MMTALTLIMTGEIMMKVPAHQENLLGVGHTHDDCTNSEDERGQDDGGFPTKPTE